jgi:hypothetical protein
MGVPTSIYAGDTVKFNIPATPDYASNQSWVGTFVLKHDSGNDALSITGVADGSGGWNFTLSTAQTAALTRDPHWFQLYVAKAGERFTLEQGSLTIIGNIGAAGNHYDGRSQAQIDLEAVQAEMRGRLNGGNGAQEYTIGNRSLKKIPMADLISLESKLKADVAREKRAERIAKGLDSGRAVYVRFGG